MAHPGGRPRALESPEKALELGEAYFAECDAADPKEPYLITGLALALGLSCRKQLDEYEARAEFTNVIKRLRAIVERGYERRVNGTTPTGSIFVLKNMGWTDQQRIEHTGADGGPMSFVIEGASQADWINKSGKSG